MPNAKNNYKREDLYKIIVVFTKEDGRTGFAKYRNIEADKPAAWKRTETFLRQKFSGIRCVNVYGGITGDFKRQINLHT